MTAKEEKKKVILVTKLPHKEQDKDGIGHYSEYLIKSSGKFEFYVVCQKTDNYDPKIDEKDYPKAKIFREFDQDNITAFRRIIKKVTDLENQGIKNLHLQYEFFSYGSPVKGAVLIITTSIISRLKGFYSIVTVHQVPLKNDIKERTNSRILRANIIYYFIMLIYTMITQVVDKVIVHESIFKERLINDYKVPVHKIEVSPIPSYDHKLGSQLKKTSSDKLSNIKDYPIKLLFFGYLSWYKGIYELIEDFVSLPKEFRSGISLTIVGGLHPNQTNEAGYMDWIYEMKSKTKNMPNVIWYGYAEDSDMNKIFTVHDALILPYRNVFSSSGPFAWAISHELPIIVSNEMSYLSELGFLSYKVGGLESVLKEFQKNQKKHKEIVSQVRRSRSIEEVEVVMDKVYK